MKRKQFRIGFHAAVRQACIIHDRKRIYLGAWPNHPGEPPAEVLEKFAQIVAKIAAGQPVTRTAKQSTERRGVGYLVAELAADWLTWAAQRYASPQTARNLRYAIQPVLDLCGALDVDEFGPKKLSEAQKAMAGLGWTRQGVNRATRFVRQMVAWGVAEERVGPNALVRLKALQPLRYGAIRAEESKPLEAVDIETVAATLPYLSPTVAAMVRLQLLTGMRPNEVTGISLADIDRSDPRQWVYAPSDHKMRHLGRSRLIPLVPEAIAILTPYLRADGKPLFSPADEVERWQKEKRATRKTRVQPSQMDRSKENPERVPGDRYDTHAYRRAIARACRKAGVDPWSPNALRKAAAQIICDSLGLDAARATLSHADSAITKRHYAKKDLGIAVQGAQVLADKLRVI